MTSSAKSYKRGMTRVAIAYPAQARVAMQSLSIHILKRLVDEDPDAYADFVFLDNLTGYVKKPSLKDFDIVLFSVHYELDYPWILRMLELSGINPWSSRRSRNDPLIVLGGPPLMGNPEPMAPFADLILIGDAEVLIPALLNNYHAYGKDLGKYVDYPGFYVPSYGKHPVEKAFARDLAYSVKLIHDTAISLRLSEWGSVFGQSAVIEVMRGCPRSCLFCMESFVQRPVRFVDINHVKDIVKRDVEKGLISGVSLIGLSVGDHPGFDELMRFLTQELRISVSVPSLRVDTINEERLRLIAGGGQKVLTIAPESSERLRKALGKGFTDEYIVYLASKAMELGFTHVKLYFMVGLPGETDDDIKSIINLLNNLRSRNVRLSLSINPWIPKPHTPLQWLPMATDEVIKRRIKALRETRIYIEFSAYDELDAKVQALLSLGDRDVANVIFEASLTGIDRGSWRRLINRYNDLLIKYVYSQKPLNEKLPWSHIRIPGADEQLLRELLMKYAEEVGVGIYA
ncbi:MAG: radical SAM protein [Vulcanisaeta sp.]